MNSRHLVILSFDAGAEVIGSATATKGDSIICRALSVNYQVAIVGKCDAGFQANLIEQSLGYWFGGDHQRVDGYGASLLTF